MTIASTINPNPINSAITITVSITIKVHHAFNSLHLEPHKTSLPVPRGILLLLLLLLLLQQMAKITTRNSIFSG